VARYPKGPFFNIHFVMPSKDESLSVFDALIYCQVSGSCPVNQMYLKAFLNRAVYIPP